MIKPIHICIAVYIKIYLYMLPYQTESGNPDDFLNPFTVCSSCKRNKWTCPSMSSSKPFSPHNRNIIQYEEVL